MKHFNGKMNDFYSKILKIQLTNFQLYQFHHELLKSRRFLDFSHFLNLELKISPKKRIQTFAIISSVFFFFRDHLCTV